MIVSTTGGCSFYFSSFCNNKGNRCRGWRRTAMLEQCRPRQEAPNLWGCTERTNDDFTRNILPPHSPFLCCPGPQRNNIPGQSTRFQPSDNYLALYYLSASQIPGFWREFRKFPHCSRSTPGIIQTSELKNRFFYKCWCYLTQLGIIVLLVVGCAWKVGLTSYYTEIIISQLTWAWVSIKTNNT